MPPPTWDVPIGEAPPDGLEQLRRLAVRFERDLRHTIDYEIRCSAFEDGDHLIFRAIWPPTIQQDLYCVPEWEEADTAVKVMDALQWSDFFDYVTDPWPRCPIHPDSTHSLTAKRFGRSAWWVCPSTGERTTPVGTLGDPTDEPTDEPTRGT